MITRCVLVFVTGVAISLAASAFFNNMFQIPQQMMQQVMPPPPPCTESKK